MAIITDSKEAVFIVGGPGTQGDAIPLAGGCTKDYFDANLDADGNFDPLLICGTDGAPIDDGDGGALSDSGLVLITKAGAFTNTVVGMVAYCTLGGYPDGRYEIVARSDDWIRIDLTYTGAGAVGACNVGGAFDSLTTVDGIPLADNFNQYIYTNKNESFTSGGGLTWTNGGDIAKNTKVFVRGFNTLCGDMERGQIYYQSINDAFRTSINSNSFVRLDGSGDDNVNIIHINGLDNFVFENLWLDDIDFDNAGGGGISRLFKFENNPAGIQVSHCVLASTKACTTDASQTRAIDCYFKETGDTGGGYMWRLNGFGNMVDRCIFEMGNGDIGASTESGLASSDSSIISNSLFYTSKTATTQAIQMSNNLVYNCTFYGMDDIVVLSGTGVIERSASIYNNIFVKRTLAGTGIINTSGSDGTIENDYNCYWSLEGEPTEAQIFEDHVSGENPTFGPNDIVANPQFVDPDNRDFRLKSSSPCLNKGFSPLDNNNISMGQWQRKSLISSTTNTRNL